MMEGIASDCGFQTYFLVNEAAKLYGVNATIIIFVFVLCCIIMYEMAEEEKEREK